MTSIFDLYTLFPGAAAAEGGARRGDGDAMLAPALAAGRAEAEAEAVAAGLVARAFTKNGSRILREHRARARASSDAIFDLAGRMADAQRGGNLARATADYLTDAAERMVLTMDALRQRGDIFLEHEAAGCPPVLVYDYEVVMDGRDLPHPCNYQLLRILPPDGVEIDDTRRPYIIIDPRAGHGPGIGGFKPDSQVGVGLRAGHPVYMVSFRRDPEPGQFISSVTRAEAAFVREVMRRHPDAEKPVMMGNCQGGWATLLVAAMNPDLTGPVVINGAPVAPWAGEVGTNPMRYGAGVNGGAWVPMFLADLGGGVFDGAHLVANFESLNPGRTLYRKYTDLFRDADTGVARFLEFERWWGGYFLMNEAEIRWIVEQLFIGNRLVKNESRIEPGRPIDIKQIKAPMIVFASHGDNITPPQQALNWIAQTYTDVDEIRIRGQRIIYMIHEQVGHLGIFVSSAVARREHSEVGSTLQTIEALAPGLYEMVIEDIDVVDGTKRFTVSFAERDFAHLEALDDGTDDERPFAAVARTSELQAQLYDGSLRPFVRAGVTQAMAEAGRALHPNRASRAIWASRNPAVAPVEAMAGAVRATRHKAAPDNPWLAWEELVADLTEQSLDLWRDLRDMGNELAFFGMWTTPWARRFGRTHETRRTLSDRAELRGLPEVTAALRDIDRGGFAEAVIRMLILLADNRGEVRRDRLERSAALLSTRAPFAELGAERRAQIIHEQTLIASYAPVEAIRALPRMLRSPEERRLAAEICRYVPGRIDEMAPHTLELLQHFYDVLELPAFTGDLDRDPMEGPTIFDHPAPRPALNQDRSAAAPRPAVAKSETPALPMIDATTPATAAVSAPAAATPIEQPSATAAAPEAIPATAGTVKKAGQRGARPRRPAAARGRAKPDQEV